MLNWHLAVSKHKRN